jgi:ATP-dependent helicase HrpA
MRVFFADGFPQGASQCDALIAKGRSRVLLIGQELLRSAAAILVEHANVMRKLPSMKSFAAAHADISRQLERLMPRDFLAATPMERMPHLPRYLKAIAMRMDKCRADPGRDQRWMSECMPLEQQLWRWAAGHRGPWPARTMEFRWMLEELRVALFAQELKTPMPVSAKRLQKAWDAMEH